MKHTKGPWDIIIHTPNLITVTGGGGGVADVSLWRGGKSGDPEENLANAQLIASAPSILSKMESLREAMEGFRESMEEAIKMLGVAAKHIRTHAPNDTTFYDESLYDGYCVADDCVSALFKLTTIIKEFE